MLKLDHVIYDETEEEEINDVVNVYQGEEKWTLKKNDL